MRTSNQIMVTMAHVRAAKLGGAGVLCAPSIRAWCDRHGIDMRTLTQQGLPLSQVQAIDDAFAQRAAAIAYAESEAMYG